MLGRLARWLRTLGFDTAYDDAISDEELVRRAFEERRYVLTRDRRLPEQWRMKNCLVLESDAPVDQLREVVAHLRLEPSERLFTRCRICNAELVPAGSEEVEARVPASVRERHTAFVRCPDCGRVYWEGSHTERMMSVLTRVFES
ncbi:MAG: hypothetical protein AMS25_16050 [Gemmatimonas sp. SM23_52]|nr:MAG: hypothetical protein AMS25_16050 [Gemmatimonas sp. SM23_52]